MNTISDCGYVNVRALLPENISGDISELLQNIIDENPNRTLFFPDGVYEIAKPILTPAHPEKSVSLLLSRYAVIKAAADWSADEAMIRLGGKDAANDIVTNGSNYSFSGGIIDGRGIADGISIDGGRETAIFDVSIKHTRIGVHVKHGANSGSSDADIHNVNIVGTGKTDSIGVLLEGYDNTVSYMRIANVFVGVDVKSAGNFLRMIHPLYTSDCTDYENSCGFRDANSNNWYTNCYSDQFGIGFRTTGDGGCTYDGCFCYWYSSKIGSHTAFRADRRFNSIVTNLNIGFRDLETKNFILLAGEPGGHGVFERVIVDPALLSDCEYAKYSTDRIIH